jgi:hypothetical protein
MTEKKVSIVVEVYFFPVSSKRRATFDASMREDPVRRVEKSLV